MEDETSNTIAADYSQPSQRHQKHQAKNDDGASEHPLVAAARMILTANDRSTYTVPTDRLYPHQWLWDSCFIAIGLAHLDPARAQTELRSLISAQWSNGMMPHMVFNNDRAYQRDRDFWNSSVNPYSPDHIATSGITQPPVLAEAVWQIGQTLKSAERRSWYAEMLPHIIEYHQWLYRERDPHNQGLVLLIHPWESGLDNTPPWTHELDTHAMPLWIRIIRLLRLDYVLGLLRRDLRFISADERLTTLQALCYISIQRRLRRKGYDTAAILEHSLLAIEDLTFNCILTRSNTRLREIAAGLHHELPAELVTRMKLTEGALEDLYEHATHTYWSRDFASRQMLTQPSIAGLMPLYSGAVSKERAAELVRLLENDKEFGLTFPVPTVPLSSPDFEPKRYWRGPSWANTNWMIIEGLRQYGYNDHAEALKEVMLDMVEQSGFAEYYDPITAEPLGAGNFSWTAAVVIDLIKRK